MFTFNSIFLQLSLFAFIFGLLLCFIFTERVHSFIFHYLYFISMLLRLFYLAFLHACLLLPFPLQLLFVLIHSYLLLLLIANNFNFNVVALFRLAWNLFIFLTNCRSSWRNITKSAFISLIILLCRCRFCFHFAFDKIYPFL